MVGIGLGDPSIEVLEARIARSVGFHVTVADDRETFASPERLLEELRELGRNLHLDRFQGLRGRTWRKQLLDTLARELSDPDDGGRLNLSFEIIYGHAFKPAPRLAVSASSAISLEQMRGALGLGAAKVP